MVQACGETPAAESTTTTSTTTTVATTSTTTTTTTEHPGRPVALADLVGRWGSETNVIQFDEGGSYELFALDPEGTETSTGVFGFVALQDGQLIFATSANPNPCPGETGVYVGELRGETLHLSVVDEPCAFREDGFAAPFTPSSTGPALSDLSGSWENERSVLRVNDAGDYVVLGPDADPDRPLTGGFVAREEANVIFVSGVAGECPGQTGVYGAVIEEDVLTLTLAEDPCADRADWFEPPFSRAG
jgi:hypothetical protein